MKLKKENHCVHQIGLHLIWCPKYRNKVLLGPIEVELKRIIGEVCGHYEWDIQQLEIMPDHVHLFVQIDPYTTGNEVIRTIKSITAIQIFTLFPQLKQQRFWGSGLWSKGSYYGGVGQVSEETIKKYIETQKEKE